MSDPLVSITSAFYNEEHYLLDMVKSVFAQTFTDWELILLDDGSTDRSLELAKSINDPRVRVYTNGTNIGRSKSLNKITTLARGKYIARFDADDMCGTTRIQREVDFLESHPEVDVVSCGAILLDSDDNPMGHRYAAPTHEEICRNPSRYIRMNHPGVLARKTWFENNPYDESISISVDANLWFRTYQHSTFANIPDTLFYYRFDKSFNLVKQFHSRKTNARYLFEHHKKDGHLGRAIAHWIFQYGKFITTVLMFATGLRKKLMGIRNVDKMSDEDKNKYLAELKMIKSLPLPMTPSP
ncbi:MAG: glycosyltransferase family 2 protein [Sedimentisphaerales bacterium]|nr:glycosyltransferase family 2 protein [Sedimentisphaerales bacterium]